MMPAYAATAVGGVGFVLLLAAFGANLLGRLRREGVTYAVLNAVGAALLALYALAKSAPIFVALEGIWSATAVAGLVVLVARGRLAEPRRGGR